MLKTLDDVDWSSFTHAYGLLRAPLLLGRTDEAIDAAERYIAIDATGEIPRFLTVVRRV